MEIMEKQLKNLGLMILLLMVIGCDKNKLDSSSGRPYQPWVFRSVLDLQPRIITFALDDNLWAHIVQIVVHYTREGHASSGCSL
jgi:hypothetical protein